MGNQGRTRHGTITRSATGPSAAEAFILIAIATILITRLYLQLAGYPQVGGGELHIAHALYGGAFMMLALILSWLALGFGVRMFCVVLGGVGFGLFLDEIGKFVTKSNDYFYGPAAEIMYVLVVVILVGNRVIRDFRPLNAQECLASAAAIAADGVARGLADRRREIGLSLVDRARAGGADAHDADNVRALLVSADHAPDRLYATQQQARRLIPGFLRSPRWVPVVGWLMVLASFLGVVFGALGVALGGYLYEDEHITSEAGRYQRRHRDTAGQRRAHARHRVAGHDRLASHPQRLAAALAAQRGADLHTAQRARGFRDRRVRGIDQPLHRRVHAGDLVLPPRCSGSREPARQKH